MTDVERISGVIAVHGEGPCWHGRAGRVLSVDMFGPSVLSTDPATGVTDTFPVAGRVAAFVRPLHDGSGVVVVGESDIQLLGGSSLIRLPLADGLRCNEGTCDPHGRLWVGTLDWDLAPGRGSMLRVSGDGEVDVVFGGLTCSNGLEWSPDGSCAYFTDSLTRRIDLFDYDEQTGMLDSRRTFVTIDEGDGTPDGLCVDADGGVWVALVGHGIVRRYDPDGSISTHVRIPCDSVTACTFGGPDLGTVFCTTSSYGGNAGHDAGSLFAFRPGVTGRNAAEFTLGTYAAA